MKKFALFVLAFIVVLSIHSFVFADEVNNFAELKAAIEVGGTKIIELKSDIVFTEQIALPAGSDITIKDDGQTRKLILDSSMVVDASSSYGKGLIFVSNGAKLSLIGTGEKTLYFDGNKNNINKNTDVTDNGLFITCTGNGSYLYINKAAFVNSKNRGFRTAPILAKDGSKVVIDDVYIAENTYYSVETSANYTLTDWSNQLNTAKAAKGSAIAIDNGAEVTINNCKILGNGYIDPSQSHYLSEQNINSDIPDGNAGSGAIALHGLNSKLVLNGGEIKNNSGGLGAAITASYGSTVEINGGDIVDNHAILGGGAVYAYGAIFDIKTNGLSTKVTNVNIKGGNFKSNTGKNGGAIYCDWNTNTNIKGGNFEGNSAQNGGAIVISDRWREGTGDDGGSQVYTLAQSAGYKNYATQWKWRSKANISGATFKLNTAKKTGGALYINSSDVKLTDGVFTENKANMYGGAIYLSSVPHVLKLNNVYIEDNKANKMNPDDVVWSHGAGDVHLYSGTGAAIWYCPTGDAKVYSSNGAAYVGNGAQRAGDDIASVTKHPKGSHSDPDINNKDFIVSVADRMLGGSLVEWYKDGSPIEASSTRYNADDTKLTEIKDVREAIAIKAIDKEGTANSAEQFAKLIFKKNEAGRGGAIGTNGTVIIGDENKEFSIKVSKKWAPELADVENNDNTNIKVNLYNVSGEKYIVDSVILNKANSYEATFDSLPLEAGDKPIKYLVLEDGDNYEVSYVNNEVDTIGMTNASVHNVVINNAKKASIETPTPQPSTTPKITKHSPKTGDNTNFAVIFALMIVSALVIAKIYKKKNV